MVETTLRPVSRGAHNRSGIVRAACVALVAAAAILLTSLGSRELAAQEVATTMTLTSSAFTEGGRIPAQYTCSGDGISPPLAWSGAPAGTKSFALIVEDPDAPMGTWIHWVVFNIPATAHELPQAVPSAARLADGSVQGVGSGAAHQFQGPCPPSGTHRYYFRIYALDTTLSLPPTARKPALIDAMKGHILAEGALMGRFSR